MNICNERGHLLQCDFRVTTSNAMGRSPIPHPSEPASTPSDNNDGGRIRRKRMNELSVMSQENTVRPHLPTKSAFPPMQENRPREDTAEPVLILPTRAMNAVISGQYLQANALGDSVPSNANGQMTANDEPAYENSDASGDVRIVYKQVKNWIHNLPQETSDLAAIDILGTSLNGSSSLSQTLRKNSDRAVDPANVLKPGRLARFALSKGRFSYSLHNRVAISPPVPGKAYSFPLTSKPDYPGRSLPDRSKPSDPFRSKKEVSVLDLWGDSDRTVRFEAGKKASAASFKMVNSDFLVMPHLPLGEGGNAKVCRAVDIEKRREVAAKLVLKSSEKPEMIFMEIAFLRNISHPNLINYIDYGYHTPHHAIFMEILDQMVDQYVKRKKKLSEEEAKPILLQVIRAVRYLHHREIGHRDIKLSNVMMDKKGTVKLTDFGHSVYEATDRFLTAYLGTQSYMAPEIRLRKYRVKPVDIWALGVCLWKMLMNSQFWFFRDRCLDLSKKNSGTLKMPKFVTGKCKALLLSTVNIDPENRPTIDRLARFRWFQGISLPEEPRGPGTAGYIEDCKDVRTTLRRHMISYGFEKRSEKETKGPATRKK